jgi:hypothetical protein
MPHVLVTNAAPLEALVAKFEPVETRFGQAIAKVSAVFHDARNGEALLQSLVVEPHVRRKFYVRLAERADGVMVKLDPLTDPEKTDSVKRLLALVADWVRRNSPGSAYGVTNIEDFLLP